MKPAAMLGFGGLVLGGWVVLATAGIGAWASEPGDEPSGVELLKQSVAAMKATNSLEAKARLEVSGALIQTLPSAQADVALKRGEKGLGGWLFAVRGESGMQAATQLAPLQSAFDGQKILSLRMNDKKVIEAAPSEREAMHEDGSAALISWATRWNELVVPFAEEADNADWVRYVGPAYVSGVKCDVVYIDYSEFEDPSLMDAWWYLSSEDKLPRRVDFHHYDEGKGDGIAKVELHDVRRDPTLTETAFVFTAPEGFVTEKRAPVTAKRAPRPSTNPSQSGGLEIGKPAPEFTLKDSSGKDHTLKDYQGKVVVLDFWATWCPPCRAAMPGIQKIHEKYSPKGVSVIGMSTSENADPVAYMKDKGFTYGLLLNAESIGAQYGVRGIPHFVVIGTDGTVLYSASGYGGEMTDNAIASAIEKALAK